MRKDTTIISDLRTFFTKNDADHAIYSLMEVMERIHIQPKQIGMAKKANCKFTPLQVLNLLIVFPFFTVKNAYRYSGSSLNKLFRCEKDMFYRFVNNGNIKWRKLLYVLNMQLLQKISKETTSPSGQPTCLIIDDTDAPKSGMKAELVGKIWSHVQQKSILGYKCLTMMLFDGVSQQFLDFSLHGEEGKNKTKRQGLTEKQQKARLSKDHTGQVVSERIGEYWMKKTDRAIEMVRYAIKVGIRFDYLLVDSWFTNTQLVRFIKSRHIKCNLLGMIKLGKTKYTTEFGKMNAQQIIKHQQEAKACKRSRKLRYTYCTMDVQLDGMPVRLFFCKRRNGKWNGLLTTDMSLDFLEAYRLYARRWTTEVAYKDCKTLLNFGKYQSRYFAAQIAEFTLTMMQYNILCLVKRSEAYETIGGLFAEVTKDILELSVADKIWAAIVDILLEIAECYSIDETLLLTDYINRHHTGQMLIKLQPYAQIS